VDQVGLVSL